MKSYEFTGKTAQKAIDEGLAKLGKKFEDVDIQIISEGGFFKKAKVVIKVEDEEPKQFAPKVEEIKEEPKEEKVIAAEPQKEVVETESKEEVAEVADEEKEEQKEEVAAFAEEPKQAEKPAEVKIAEKPKHHKSNNKHYEDYVMPTQEELEEKRRRFAEKHFMDNKTSVEFVDGLLKVLNVPGTVTLTETREASEILVETEDAAKIIGYRGDCLAAIQYIANIVEDNANPNAKRVTVDAGDYKQKREQNLRALAIRIAGKVSETGRIYKLEPMSAYERRIIHTELQNYPSIETHSEGVEPYRRIVVTKKKN